MAREQIPVYLVTGFLEAGKTKLIQGILEDPEFNNGARILLLVCEEGVEEYDPTLFPSKNVLQLPVENERDLTLDLLADYTRNHKIDRVIVEYNGMWQLETLYAAMPHNWAIFQQLFVADASTIGNYNANMRSLVFDKLQDTESVIFNRAEGMNREALHKLVRGISRRASIAYETADGELEYDTIEDPLPFDKNAPVILIKDEDYALFYSDIADTMPDYDGKTIKFRALVARDGQLGKRAAVVGRHVMTCCADDIAFQGLVANFERDCTLSTGEWAMITAKIRIEKHKLYGSAGPVLYVTDVALTSAPAQPVATFY